MRTPSTMQSIERVDALVWRAFPTDRRVGLRLLWLLDDPKARVKQIARLIAADPALSVRVLSIANAPFYGETGRITTVPRAVSLIGLPATRSLASTTVLQLFSAEDALPDTFWVHAITAAVAGARIAHWAEVNADEAFTAALLHDFGEQLLRSRDRESFDELVRATEAEPMEVRLTLEREMFRVDHATLGLNVLKSLGLPAVVTNAVKEHHHAGTDAGPLARVVRVADGVAKVIQGDPYFDLDETMRLVGFSESADSLVAEARTDQRTLLRFVADFFDASTLVGN